MAATSPEFALSFQEHNSLIPVSSNRFVYEGHTLQGARCDFLMQTFADSVNKRFDATLTNIIIGLHQEIFHIPIDQAEREVKHNRRGRFKIESTILANTLRLEERGRDKLLAMILGLLVSPMGRTFSGRFNLPSKGTESEPNYIGYSTQEEWSLNTENGIVKVMYVSGFGVLPEYRRMGLGAKFLGIANSVHEPDIILLRLRSGAAVAALRKSELIHGKVVPFEMTYDEDPLMRAVLALADKKTAHPNPINAVTGVTKAVYEEGKDLAYEPDPSHPVASLVDRQIGKIMNPDDGDGVYVAIRVIGRERWSTQTPQTADRYPLN